MNARARQQNPLRMRMNSPKSIAAVNPKLSLIRGVMLLFISDPNLPKVSCMLKI
jgi:hypothetical protein